MENCFWPLVVQTAEAVSYPFRVSACICHRETQNYTSIADLWWERPSPPKKYKIIPLLHIRGGIQRESFMWHKFLNKHAT